MSQYHASEDLICTPFELKEFAFSISGDNPTAINFARFIEYKSQFKYTVIEIEFLLDAFKKLEEHFMFSARLNKDFKERWRSLDIPTIKLF